MKIHSQIVVLVAGIATRCHKCTEVQRSKVRKEIYVVKISLTWSIQWFVECALEQTIDRYSRISSSPTSYAAERNVFSEAITNKNNREYCREALRCYLSILMLVI